MGGNSIDSGHFLGRYWGRFWGHFLGHHSIVNFAIYRCRCQYADFWSDFGSSYIYPFQIAHGAGFWADIGAVFWAKKILLNCHPGVRRTLNLNCFFPCLVERLGPTDGQSVRATTVRLNSLYGSTRTESNILRAEQKRTSDTGRKNAACLRYCNIWVS